MNDSKQANFAVPMLVFMAAIVSLIIACFGYFRYLAEQHRTTFVPTAAVVTASHTTLRRSGSVRSRSYYLTEVEFEYGSGNTTRDKTMSLAASWLHPEWGNAERWDEGYWRRGQDFTIYVNPGNGDDWSLDRGPSRETYATLIGGVVASLVFCGLFYPSLFALFSKDPGPIYLPSDDPRMLARDTRMRW